MNDGPYKDYGCRDPAWLSIDWRDHLHAIDLEGADRVAYVDIGEGPPVLLIHGLGGRWQNWLENIPALAERHRVLALDLPGFGATPMPRWDITMPAYGRMIIDFCESLSLHGTALVGNSMGGFIATESVIDRAAEFEKLILVSAAGVSYARARQEPAKMIGRISQLARPALINFGDDAVTRPRLRRVSFAGVVHRPDLLGREALWELAQGALGPDGFHDALVSLTGYDVRRRLEEIDIQTLIVWGYNDRVVPVRGALSYRRRIPYSRLEIFDRTGHVPMIERPARFNRLLGEFLAGERIR